MQREVIMIEKILDYQKVETEVLNLESELSKSKDREKAVEIQQTMKNQHARLLTLEKLAEKVNGSYKKAVDKYNEYMKKLESLEKELEEADETKVAVYEKAYKDFFAVANTLEKDIAQMYAQVQQINREYEEIIKKSKVDREKFDKFRTSYAKFKAEREPKIEEFKAKLKDMKKLVDGKLFDKYMQKREGKLFPVFVAVSLNKCGGCRMEISASKLASMKNNEYGVIECENCGRYIYQK